MGNYLFQFHLRQDNYKCQSDTSSSWELGSVISGVNARYLASSEFIVFLPDQLVVVDEWLVESSLENMKEKLIIYIIVNANLED